MSENLTSIEKRLIEHNQDDSEETKLLKLWLEWFLTAEYAPAKMPNALHIRTIVRLSEINHERKER